MLPIVNPSDPSCSSSETPALRDDEKDYSQLASCEADPRVLGFDDSQTCNFSIRDYVFASRSKNILTSWPFPRQILKFCVKHGVRELLPPFEPPSSVRAHCWRRRASETQKISFDAYQAGDGLPLNGENKIAKSDSWLPSEDVSVKCFDDAAGVVISKSAKPVESARGECEISSTVTTPDIGKILSQVGEPVVKNSSSTLDQVAAVDLSRAEEIASTTTTVSDPMASKVCPVCKTFSSTSNTTLNAHMDQCLFMESDTNRVGDIVPKVKLKPRKKRLMVDIYATAPLCTLEDLDRRNGTSWATGLAFVPPTIDTTTVAEEPNLLQEETKDDEREGAVYVDSNGIKLRILSKFNDAPQLTSKEELWPIKDMEIIRDGKLLSMGKKCNLADKHTKKMKMKLKKRKLSSLKLLKDEMTTIDVGHEETHGDEQEPMVQLSSKQEHVGIGESTSLRRWPCSKRSHLSKKIINKNFQKSLDSTKPVGGIPSHENKKPPSTYAANSHVTKLYRPSDSAAIDFTTKAVENQNSQKESNAVRPQQGTCNIVRLKLPKSCENLDSSSEDFSVASKKFDNIPEAKEKPTGSSLHSPKSRRFLNLSETNSMGNNFRKYSLMRTGKRKRVISDEYHGLQKPTNTVTDFPAKVLTETSLNPGYNQQQYSETRNSETLTETVATSERRTASKKAGSICTVLETCTENQSPTRNAVIETSTVQLVEEDGQPKKQELHFRQDKQAVNEFSRTMSAQESSACLTSHGELMPDYLEDPVVQEDDNNLAIERELSGSPASSASTISPPSPDYTHLRPSYTETVTRPSVARNMMSLHSVGVSEGIQGTNVLSNCQILGDYTVRLHEQRSDYQPCCCIRQNFLTTNLLTPPKEFPNFFSRSSISYLSDSYSESRANTISTPVLESPTDSVMSRACGDSASPNPSCGTPMQHTTGSVFRLMGKNLMVMNTEESDQLPKFLPPNTVNSSQGQALPSSAFASYAGVPTHRSFSNTLKSQPPCEGLFCAKPTKMSQEARMTKDHQDEDIAYRNDLPQVSVLGSMLQRPFPWFTSHGQHLSRDDGARPAFFINRGSSWKCPESLLQSPVVFQSPASQLNASLHHLQSSR
ncbi:hypothetical protein HPP92_022546 [Vanilla planifolia]|uniref:UBZ4-type domain-containing protein n=1 Tax=Vanilla planifolia TaxID=51239 RepID=A0A835PUY5_VANPL|nr:hypothetical protein HPP92_022546 [Vanilla planifolia]